jgi:hypothetical protein
LTGQLDSVTGLTPLDFFDFFDDLDDLDLLSTSLRSTGPKEIVYPHGDHTDLLSEDTLSILRAER